MVFERDALHLSVAAVSLLREAMLNWIEGRVVQSFYMGETNIRRLMDFGVMRAVGSPVGGNSRVGDATGVT